MKSDLRKEFSLDALDMTDIVLVLEQIFRLKIPQWALTELFVTPMDIVDFICDKLGVFWIDSERFSAYPVNKSFLFITIRFWYNIEGFVIYVVKNKWTEYCCIKGGVSFEKKVVNHH